MTPAEHTSLRRIYGEICRGYSVAKWDGKPVYVGHLTTFDQTEIDILQDEAFHDAKKRGIRTEADQLKRLEVKKIWTAKDERTLNDQRLYVDGLKVTRSKLFLKGDIERMSKQIGDETVKLDDMRNKRARAIGLTAEHVGEQRIQLEYIRATFYRDIDLREPLFTDHAMRELSDEESDDLLVSYIDIVTRFSDRNVRRVAMQGFFLNQFSLCGSQVRDFFGVPIVDLTIYQANLLSYGQHYLDVFSNHQIPPEMADDPDKIKEYLTRSTNAKKAMAKTDGEGGRTGIVGGSSEDLSMMGVQDGTNDMQKLVSKGYKDARSAAPEAGYTVVNK